MLPQKAKLSDRQVRAFYLAEKKKKKKKEKKRANKTKGGSDERN